MTKDDERAILWLAIEDYSGLWEVVWQLRSLRPEDPNDALIQRAKDVVAELLQRNWADLFHCEEPYGKLSKISPDEAAASLSQASVWEEPKVGEVSIRIGVTSAGQEAYEQSPGSPQPGTIDK